MIFFRRIFGVLNGPIRTPAKPLRMFFDIRMIGAALIGEIQSDFEAERLGFSDQAFEIFERPETADESDLWPPSSAPIAHGLPGSFAVAVTGLFFPLRWVCPIG